MEATTDKEQGLTDRLRIFLAQRRADWQKLEGLLEIVDGSGLSTLNDEQAVAFARLYRHAASDLNQAQTFISGDATVQYLNDLVARCYLVIYAKNRTDSWRVVRSFFGAYPAVFRRYSRHFLLATTILAGTSVVSFVACLFDAQSARSFLLPADMGNMIQPGREGPLMDTGQLAAMSNLYFRHNLSVALVAFALGLTLGIGTVWLLAETGVMLGGLAAVFVEAGQFQAFCTEILPHGVLEIPAILIAAAGGFLLAQGLIRARPWPRREELARTGKGALMLVSGCVPLLAMAAVLEAVVARAPSWFLDSGIKLLVAALFALLFTAYVLLVGWKKQTRQ